MNEAMVTFVSPLKSLEDRLLGNTEICFWEINSKGQLVPGSDIVSLEYIIPSKAISVKDYSEQNAIEEDYSNLLLYLSKKFNKKRESIIKELSKIKNTHTKSYEKKLNQFNSLSLFLDDITSRVYLEKSYIENNVIYSLHIPFLDSRDFPLGFSQSFQTSQRHKKYNSISQSVKRQLGFPFSKVYIKEDALKDKKVDIISSFKENSAKATGRLGYSFNSSKSPYIPRIHIEGKKEFFSVEYIASQKGLAIDIETTNYLPISLPEEFNSLSEQELKQFLEKNKVFSIKELELMNKKSLLRATKDFLDSKRDERITTISLASLDSNENYLLTTFDLGIEKILVKSPLDEAENKKPESEFKIIKFDSQTDMIAGAIKKIEEINPLFVYGHNQLKFDYQKLSEFSSEGFNAGINGKPLKYIHSILGQYIINRVLPGRIDLDPALYSQFYMSNKNNRLDMVFEAVTGTFSKKTLTHEELEDNTKLAEKGDLSKAQEILYYAAQDVLKSHAIGEGLKREHILLSRLYSSLPSRIDTTSPKSLVEEYWANKHLSRFKNLPVMDIALETIVLKTIPHLKNETNKKTSSIPKTSQASHFGTPVKSVKFGDFSSIDFFLKEGAKDNQMIKSKTGLQDAYLVYFSPIINSFLPLLEEDENVRAIAIEIKDSEPQKKLRLSRSLNYLCEYPYFKFLQSKPSFLKEFGLNEAEDIYKNIVNSLSLATDTLFSIISSPEFLNIKEDLILLKANINSEKLIEKLKEAGIGFSLGKYKALSGKKGIMIGANSSWSFMLGTSDPDSKRGEKTPFESDFERELIDSLLYEEDRLKPVLVFAKYAKMLADDLSQYNNNEIINNPYYQAKKTLRRDSSDFSSHGMSKYKRLAIQSHAKEGDLITLTNTKEGLYKRLFNCEPFNCEQFNYEPDVTKANIMPSNISTENSSTSKNPQTTKHIIKTKTSGGQKSHNHGTYTKKSSKNPNQLSFDFYQSSKDEFSKEIPLIKKDKSSLDLAISQGYASEISLYNTDINYNPAKGKLTRILSWAYKISQSNLKRRALHKIILNDYSESGSYTIKRKNYDDNEEGFGYLGLSDLVDIITKE